MTQACSYSGLSVRACLLGGECGGVALRLGEAFLSELALRHHRGCGARFSTRNEIPFLGASSLLAVEAVPCQSPTPGTGGDCVGCSTTLGSTTGSTPGGAKGTCIGAMGGGGKKIGAIGGRGGIMGATTGTGSGIS
jgi:hypothetical protein